MNKIKFKNISMLKFSLLLSLVFILSSCRFQSNSHSTPGLQENAESLRTFSHDPKIQMPIKEVKKNSDNKGKTTELPEDKVTITVPEPTKETLPDVTIKHHQPKKESTPKVITSPNKKAEGISRENTTKTTHSKKLREKNKKTILPIKEKKSPLLTTKQNLPLTNTNSIDQQNDQDNNSDINSKYNNKEQKSKIHEYSGSAKQQNLESKNLPEVQPSTQLKSDHYVSEDEQTNGENQVLESINQDSDKDSSLITETPYNEFKESHFEVINFSSGYSLQIDFPDIACPKNIRPEKMCFHKAPYFKTNLILDPGHELSLDSVRNGRHNEISEGYLNMVVATLTKLMLKKCFPFNEQTQTGIKNSNILLSHYPGESHYGQYIFNNEKHDSNKIIAHKSLRRTKHINQLLTTNGGEKSSGVIISIHADAPDYSKDGHRKTEHPATIYPKTRPNSAPMAKSMYTELVNILGPHFPIEQQEKFKISPMEDGRTLYPMLRLAKSNKNNYGFINTNIDDQEVRIGSLTHGILNELYAGNEDTESVLIEGFFMDSLGLAPTIQEELSQEGYIPRILYTVIKNDNIKPLLFPTFDLKIHGETDGRIHYSTQHTGEELGLKISKVYKAYAESITKGLQEAYSCSTEETNDIQETFL